MKFEGASVSGSRRGSEVRTVVPVRGVVTGTGCPLLPLPLLPPDPRLPPPSARRTPLLLSSVRQRPKVAGPFSVTSTKEPDSRKSLKSTTAAPPSSKRLEVEVEAAAEEEVEEEEARWEWAVCSQEGCPSSVLSEMGRSVALPCARPVPAPLPLAPHGPLLLPLSLPLQQTLSSRTAALTKTLSARHHQTPIVRRHEAQLLGPAPPPPFSRQSNAPPPPPPANQKNSNSREKPLPLPPTPNRGSDRPPSSSSNRSQSGGSTAPPPPPPYRPNSNGPSHVDAPELPQRHNSLHKKHTSSSSHQSRSHAPPPPPAQTNQAARPPPPARDPPGRRTAPQAPPSSSSRNGSRDAPPPPPPYRGHSSDPRMGKPPPPPSSSSSSSLSSRTPAGPPPPPPPIRNGHSNLPKATLDDFESKFNFHPIDDLPPPEEYRYFNKVYPSKHSKAQMRGAPPAPPVGSR
ncbi:hypothetical protein WMY93_006496 [Mugilogobius chulae]|uniref:WAS/WASL interacting protein family member 2 n=1 Tax=Mugilogobius chulae TaxID=88201 RepID=A0AAW0PWI8_9GOBI